MAMTYHDLGAVWRLSFGVFCRNLHAAASQVYFILSLIRNWLNWSRYPLNTLMSTSPVIPLTSVGAQLPEHPVSLRLIFAVARYPHHVVAHEVGRFGQILVHKLLADIQYGFTPVRCLTMFSHVRMRLNMAAGPPIAFPATALALRRAPAGSRLC